MATAWAQFAAQKPHAEQRRSAIGATAATDVTGFGLLGHLGARDSSDSVIRARAVDLSIAIRRALRGSGSDRSALEEILADMEEEIDQAILDAAVAVTSDVGSTFLRQLRPDARKDVAHPLDDLQQIGGGRDLDADVHGLFAVEPFAGQKKPHAMMRPELAQADHRYNSRDHPDANLAKTEHRFFGGNDDIGGGHKVVAMRVSSVTNPVL